MSTTTERQSDKRKQSLYFPVEMLKEIQAEAARLDRSLSWVVQSAWKAGRQVISNMQGYEYAAVGGRPSQANSPANLPPEAGADTEA